MNALGSTGGCNSPGAPMNRARTPTLGGSPMLGTGVDRAGGSIGGGNSGIGVGLRPSGSSSALSSLSSSNVDIGRTFEQGMLCTQSLAATISRI